jgi:small subunit ribosomal protein S6
MCIVKPDLDDDQQRVAVEGISKQITTNGGSIVKTTPWGRRKLAYDINNFRDGSYHIVNFEAEPTIIRELDRTLELHDSIIRHLIVQQAGVASALISEISTVAQPELAPREERGIVINEEDAVPAMVEEEV